MKDINNTIIILVALSTVSEYNCIAKCKNRCLHTSPILSFERHSCDNLCELCVHRGNLQTWGYHFVAVYLHLRLNSRIRNTGYKMNIMSKWRITDVQCHSRLSKLVSTESAWSFSYYWSIVTLYPTVSEILNTFICQIAETAKNTETRRSDIATSRSEICIFSPVYPSPFSFEAPAIVVHLRHDSWSQKLESLWHPAVETANRMIIQLLVLTHYQHVTDR